MAPARWMVVLVVGMMVVGLVTAVPTGMATGEVAMEDELDIDADDIVLRADLHDDGDATFSIEYRLQLDDEADRDAFDELAQDIDENQVDYVERFEDRFGPVVEDAAAATDRDMSMAEITISTETRHTDRQYGIVTFRFTWTAFAVADGTDIHAGDALDGLFLTEDTGLIIQWPDEYALVEAMPEPDSTSSAAVSWNGPRDFAADEPRVHISADEDVTVADDDWLSLPLVFAAALILLLAVGIGGWYHRQGGVVVTPDDGDATDPPDELLSNEEQVLRLVENRGGRMKQQEVSEALGWTAAKTSKVVGSLRDEGDLEAFRLGRENVLRLPEEDEAP